MVAVDIPKNSGRTRFLSECTNCRSCAATGKSDAGWVGRGRILSWVADIVIKRDEEVRVDFIGAAGASVWGR